MILLRPRKRGGTYEIPQGGEIYWYGLAATLPAEWSLDLDATDCMILGADTSDNTLEGSDTHTHSYSTNTGSVSNHSHSVHHNGTGGASGSTSHYGTSNANAADSGHSHSGKSGSSSSAGGHSHGLSDTGSASSLPPYKKLYLIKAGAGAKVPLGGILLWTRDKGEIPRGFQLCDGTQGTRDLVDKFVKITLDDSDLGDTGGALAHTHTNPNTLADGKHRHSFSLGTGSASTSKVASGYEGGSVAAGHSHTVSDWTNYDPDHSHTIPDTGSATSLPSYVYIYYIQKVA